ncbi:hypothetical protein EVAR_49931_1 [Eumeta japonica]|uniref:Uncharacterized protein n=1 Tax=Eumeta variegata TaxID=151549 RepID=A0A4C1XSL8_EUMVA|nr:hypothetical protein EVAR_49931_1 [Eumeta japonica]
MQFLPVSESLSDLLAHWNAFARLSDILFLLEKAENALITALGLRMSKGSDGHLLSGDSRARLPHSLVDRQSYAQKQSHVRPAARAFLPELKETKPSLSRWLSLFTFHCKLKFQSAPLDFRTPTKNKINYQRDKRLAFAIQAIGEQRDL